MRKCSIPQENRDLRRYAFFTNFKRIALFILWCAMWVLAYRFYLEYPINKPLVWWLLLIFAGGVLVGGWFLCSMTAFVRERSFFGKVEEMKLDREFQKGVVTARQSDEEMFRVLIVRDERGKRRRLRFKMKESGFGLYYRDGAEIAYFRGTKFPLCLDTKDKDACMCVACGTRNYPEWRDGEKGDRPTHCALCGRTLVDVEKLKR